MPKPVSRLNRCIDYIATPLCGLHWFVILTIGFWIFLFTGDAAYAIGWMMLLFSLRLL